MKILWWSTAPWSPSSYSVLTERVVPDIVRDGHTVVLGTWYGLQGNPLPWNIQDRKNGHMVGTVTVLPSVDGGNYGSGVIDVVYEEFKPDVLITCSDVWVFPEEKTRFTNFCPWLPVDHSPAPPPVVEALEPAIYPMVFSQWGAEVLNEAGIEAHYVPCSAPSDIFKPGDKAEARKRFGLREGVDFLAAIVAANKDPQDRKGFNEALTGFARFAESHPDAYLYIHTNWEGPVKIQRMLKTLGIEERALMPDQFRYNFGMLGQGYMANCYQAADVLLNCAKSEGFGLPILEAQLCGCPVAATNYSTTNELLFAGWKIPTVPDWTVGAESFRARATIDGVVETLEAAYQARNNKTLRLQARRGALELDTERVYERYWRPALAGIEKLIFGRPGVFAMREAVAA